METAVLISDYGVDSPYAMSAIASLEQCGLFGKVLSLTSSIKPFRIKEAGYVNALFLKQFPENTTFILAVNFTDRLKHTAIVRSKVENQFIISYNSGIQHLVAMDKPLQSQCIGRFTGNHNAFVQEGVIPSLRNESSINDHILQLFQQQPVLQENSLVGHILYIDKHGNAHSNISKPLLEPFIESSFEIRLSRHESSRALYEHPDHVSLGQIACAFNEAGRLAVYSRGGSAAQLLGLKTGRIIEIERL